MGDWWDDIRGLFQKAESSSPSHPAIHEMIERSSDEKVDFQHWKETIVRRRLQDWLFDQYAIFQALPHETDETLDFLSTPSSKGFAIHFSMTRYSQRDVQHYFDFLKERVLAQNYRIQISDRRTYNRKEWIETVERHYLKPRQKKQESQKLRQGFGNITIEHVKRDELSHLLKFRATIYRDHQFEDARGFRELMQLLAAE